MRLDSDDVTGEAGGDASRPFYQSQRPDSKLGLEKQVNIDPRSQPHEEEMDIGYEEKTLSPTFEGLEEKFLDDIMKLTKEQTDAEDAEIARHREVLLNLRIAFHCLSSWSYFMVVFPCFD